MAAINGTFYEAGLHVGEVISQGLTRASTGTTQFVLQVKILGTPNTDGTYAPHKYQYARTVYNSLTEKTMPFVIEALQALGYTGNSVSQLSPGHPQHVSFVKRQVDLWCKHENDQAGDLRERWQISKGVRELQLEELTPRETRELDALFGKALRSAGTAGKAPPAKPKPAPPAEDGHPDYGYMPEQDPTEITDDDLPF